MLFYVIISNYTKLYLYHDNLCDSFLQTACSSSFQAMAAPLGIDA